MSNPWSGQIAKSIASKKRTRVFWNVFFCVIILGVLFAMASTFYQIASENFSYDSEQIFVEYKDGYLFTDIDSFKVPKENKQEIKIGRLIRTVDKGEQITLTVSTISGELLEVKHLDNIVYKKTVTPPVTTVIVSLIIILPVLISCVFMLVVVNAKNPSKKIDQLQKQLLLRFYK